MSVAIDRRPASKFEVHIPKDDYILLGKIAKRLGRHANAPALFSQLVEKFLESYDKMKENSELPALFLDEAPLPGPYVGMSIRVADEVREAIDAVREDRGENWDFNRTIMTLGHLGLQELMTGPLSGRAF